MSQASFRNFTKVPELQRRLIFTLVCLMMCRATLFAPLPFVDRAMMAQIVTDGQEASSGFMTLLNFFTGGALELLSVCTLGITPFICGSILLQTLSAVVPVLKSFQREGEQGRRRINQYTRYATLGLSVVQGFAIALFLESLNASHPGLVSEPGWGFRLMTTLTLSVGAMWLMWIGEQITERGIGNGVSLIVSVDVLAELPGHVFKLFLSCDHDWMGILRLVFVLCSVVLASTASIVFIERAQRHLTVQYAKRMVGKKIYGGQTSYLPLKANTAGVIPPIFTMHLLLFVSTVANVLPEAWALPIRVSLVPGCWVYNMLVFLFVVFFAFFMCPLCLIPLILTEDLEWEGTFQASGLVGKQQSTLIRC